MIKHFSIRVNGEVQGIGFRYEAKKTADVLGVYGVAQNLPDGTLSIEAEGEEERLQEFFEWCQSGPAGARVSNVEHHVGDVKGYSTFEILA